MLFDFIVGNPAFNISSEDNKNLAGTGGNTTLYKTATKHGFNLLKPNGILSFITLKGIITELTNGYFKDKQVHNINFMDDIDIWSYNTCYFYIENETRYTDIKLIGGMSTKIYSLNDTIPFVYYSAADKIFDRYFQNGRNKVIRRLPGRNNSIIYDYTDKEIEIGPKFAFYVMESQKSYTITDEPIYGGTICYVPTNTLEDAEKIKLFVMKNKIFKEYVKRMKIRGHAFGLRNVKNFNFSQIITGEECPVEWNLTSDDLMPPKKYENEINLIKSRVKVNGEVFTPFVLVNKILDGLEYIRNDIFINPNYTFCDTMCGDGQFLIEIYKRKIQNKIPHDIAISTLYGVDIMQDNIINCRARLGNDEILNKNIICTDTFKYDFKFN